MKQAVFLALDHGQDGRDRESIRFASTVEAERDQFIETSKVKQYLSKADRVIDLAEQHDKALKKLDGLDKLALGLHKPVAMRGSFNGNDPQAIIGKIAGRISGMNIEDMTLAEKQVMRILVSCGILVEDDDGNFYDQAHSRFNQVSKHGK